MGSFLKKFKLCIHILLKSAHFYLKPGICYQKYPGFLEYDYKKNKYLKIGIKYFPFATRGIRKVWCVYDELIMEKDINKLEILLKEVEGMLNMVRQGKNFHISMSKTEQEMSLKRLIMNLYSDIGSLNECLHNYDKALNNYDRGASFFKKFEFHYYRELQEIKDKIYINIRNLFRRRYEKTEHDVLLINTGSGSLVMPWSLIVLGTKLVNEGKRVYLMDGCLDEAEILKEASCSRLIGFSVMSLQIGSSLRLSRQIKKLCPDKFIVWGGVHPTLFPEQCLQEHFIDFVIFGDGEDALTILSTRLENKNYNFYGILGLGFKDNGKLIMNPMGSPSRFVDAGPWKFELIDVQRYLQWPLMHVDFKHPEITLLTSRGCPKGCTFCINSVVKHGRMYRVKPVESILDEIEQLIHKYHVRTINFIDEVFFIDKNRLLLFVDEILKRGLQFEWGGNIHISDILKNKDLILYAKKSGLIWVSGSGESASNRILKLLKKGITLEDTLECMRFIADNDLMIASNFMTHLPTETPEEIKATMNLIEYLRNMFKERNNPSYIMGPSIYRPYPGSILYDMCVASGFKQPQTLDEWGKMIMPDGNFKLDNITWLGK